MPWRSRKCRAAVSMSSRERLAIESRAPSFAAASAMPWPMPRLAAATMITRSFSSRSIVFDSFASPAETAIAAACAVAKPGSFAVVAAAFAVVAAASPAGDATVADGPDGGAADEVGAVPSSEPGAAANGGVQVVILNLGDERPVIAQVDVYNSLHVVAVANAVDGLETGIDRHDMICRVAELIAQRVYHVLAYVVGQLQVVAAGRDDHRRSWSQNANLRIAIGRTRTSRSIR